MKVKIASVRAARQGGQWIVLPPIRLEGTWKAGETVDVTIEAIDVDVNRALVADRALQDVQRLADELEPPKIRVRNGKTRQRNLPRSEEDIEVLGTLPRFRISDTK